MIDYIIPHVIGITESWANNVITHSELGLAGCVTFTKDKMGRRGEGVLFYLKYSRLAYGVQLWEEADCEDMWYKLVTWHKTITMCVVNRCPNITKESNEKIQNVIREVNKGDVIVRRVLTVGKYKGIYKRPLLFNI